MNPRISAATPIGPQQLRLVFTDGSVGVVDLTDTLARHGGLLAALRDPAFFAKVTVEAGTVAWPNGVDLDPDVLFEAARTTPSRTE
jgi:hypothetical protein